MKRRTFIIQSSMGILGMAAGLLFSKKLFAESSGETIKIKKIVRSEEEWRKLLSKEEFQVLRKEATEKPFTSPLLNNKEKGTYVCAGCQLPLFKSETKYDSGTGWPSFTAPIEGSVETKKDFLLLFPRTEYHCARCGGHQGHVFNDGPPPKGKRWCNNGIALNFIPEAG